MPNALERLLQLPERERQARGLTHTPREILQQPATWRRTYDLVRERRVELRRFLGTAGVGSRAAPFVVLAGAGSSDYVGRSIVHLLRTAWRTRVEAIPSTDLLTNMHELVPDDQPGLWISFSRSGDSSEAVAVVEGALDRFPQVRHLFVTCNANGRLATGYASRGTVACLTLDDAVNDRGLAMTSSFTNMVVAGQCLAHVDDLAAYAPVVDRMAVAAETMLATAPDAVTLLVADAPSRMVFLGTGPLAAAAREAALKVVELTAGRIVAFSESYLGLRHGPLSAIDDETLVAAFVSSEPAHRAYELDLLAELKRKGVRRVSIVAGSTQASDLDGLARTILDIGDARGIPDLYRPPIDAIAGQLIGLFASISCGLAPDTPSPNGAIARVVEGVRIHI